MDRGREWQRIVHFSVNLEKVFDIVPREFLSEIIDTVPKESLFVIMSYTLKDS